MIIRWLILTTLLTTILLRAHAEEEPSLHGKPLSYWAQLLKSDDHDLAIRRSSR
jgi:hypothetical protein